MRPSEQAEYRDLLTREIAGWAEHIIRVIAFDP